MPSRGGPTKYKLYKCARCPDKHFDVLRISKSIRTLPRCLEYHITRMHPDQRDWTSLIGEITILERTPRAVNLQNTSIYLTPATTSPSPSQVTSAPQSAGDTAIAYCQTLINAYDPSENYDIAGLAQHARNTAAVISTLVRTGHSIKVALCVWDQAAIQGKLDQTILRLAKDAFPSQTINFHNSTCSTSHVDTGKSVVKFYAEKAKRFEARVRE